MRADREDVAEALHVLREERLEARHAVRLSQVGESPGEVATAELRALLARHLEGRPDLLGETLALLPVGRLEPRRELDDGPRPPGGSQSLDLRAPQVLLEPPPRLSVVALRVLRRSGRLREKEAGIDAVRGEPLGIDAALPEDLGVEHPAAQTPDEERCDLPARDLPRLLERVELGQLRRLEPTVPR